VELQITKIISISRNFDVFIAKIDNFGNHQKTAISKLSIFAIKTSKFRKIDMISVYLHEKLTLELILLCKNSCFQKCDFPYKK